MHVTAFDSLSPRQQTAFVVSAIGAVFPVFFVAAVRPVFWLATFQLVCVAGVAYIRWRSPAFGGSAVVFGASVVACLASAAAAAAA